MPAGIPNSPILYSTITELAYNIAVNYYDDVHFVWCTTAFDSFSQPGTSNPKTLCCRYIEQIYRRDQHAVEVNNNKAGVLRGASCKLNAGVISQLQYEEICMRVRYAEPRMFLPVVLLINTNKVRNKCLAVQQADRAGLFSIEYKIENLLRTDFQAIFLGSILSSIRDCPNAF